MNHRRSMVGPQPIDTGGFDGRVVRRVWRFGRPYRWRLLAYVATFAAQALVQLIPALVFRQIIDEAIPSSNDGLLHVLAMGAVLTAAAMALLGLLERYWSAAIGEGIIYDLRVALFDHIQRQPLTFFTRTRSGALISRLNNDVMGAQRAFLGTVGSVVSSGLVLTTTVAAMALLEWRLTLLALVVLPMFVLPAKRMGGRLKVLTRQRMDRQAAMTTTMAERFQISGALLVKLFGRPEIEHQVFAERAAEVRDTAVKASLASGWFYVLLGSVAAVGTAAVYWIGALLVMSGSISIGTLVALAAYVTRLYNPLTALTNARVDLMSALVSFERIFEVLDTSVPVANRPGAIDLVDARGAIELDNVSFAYPRDPLVATLEQDPDVALQATTEEAAAGDVLQEVSVEIASGELVALVGRSGAGKTTLAMLVAQVYEATAGAVRVDGHDVRDLTRQSLQDAIGVVTQNPHLFHDTVANNLRYANPDCSDAELTDACRAAHIHDRILQLPAGYDTTVGEQGHRVSGGEKQRLAIARVLLKDPAVVILDEATSHLDSESELAVQRALAAALAGRTRLVIAHRLSTITAADQILVLDHGRIVERGRHDSLLVARGLYAGLYETLIRNDLRRHDTVVGAHSA